VSKQLLNHTPANLDTNLDRILQLETRIEKLERNQLEDRVSLIVLSGDLDKLFAAFTIGSGAAAMGMAVTLFFTFWGLNGLKAKSTLTNKTITEKMMSLMMPSGLDAVGVSRLNMMGMGATFFRKVMANKNVASLSELRTVCQDLDVQLVACEMSMDIMGLERDELVAGVEYGGVASYLAKASKSKVNLFI